VLFNAGLEVRINVGFIAHVRVHDQNVRIDVFESANWVMLASTGVLGVGGGVGHFSTFLAGRRPGGPPVLFAFWH
jgi:hypothetical protein